MDKLHVEAENDQHQQPPLMCAHAQVYKCKVHMRMCMCSTVQLQSEMFPPPRSHGSVRPPPSAPPAPVPNPTQTESSDLPPHPPRTGRGIGGTALEMVRCQRKRELFDGGVQWSLFSQDEDEAETHRAGIVLTSKSAFLCDLICFSIFMNQPSPPLPETPLSSGASASELLFQWVGTEGKGGVFSLFRFNFLPTPLPRTLTRGCRGADESSDQSFRFSKKKEYIRKFRDRAII